MNYELTRLTRCHDDDADGGKRQEWKRKFLSRRGWSDLADLSSCITLRCEEGHTRDPRAKSIMPTFALAALVLPFVGSGAFTLPTASPRSLSGFATSSVPRHNPIMSMARTTSEELIPRDVLFGNPENTSPILSPDGNYLAYLAPSPDGVMNIVSLALSVWRIHPSCHF